MNELVGPKSIKKESATIVDEWRYSGRSTFHFYVFFFVQGWRFRTRTLNFIDVSGSMEGQGLTCRGIMSLRRVHCRA